VLPPPAALPKQFPPVEKQREWLGPCWDPRGKLWLPLTYSFESEPNFSVIFPGKMHISWSIFGSPQQNVIFCFWLFTIETIGFSPIQERVGDDLSGIMGKS